MCLSRQSDIHGNKQFHCRRGSTSRGSVQSLCLSMTKSLKAQSLGSQAADLGLYQDSFANICHEVQRGKLKPCLLFYFPIFFCKETRVTVQLFCNCPLRSFAEENGTEGDDALLHLETAKAEITTKTNCWAVWILVQTVTAPTGAPWCICMFPSKCWPICSSCYSTLGPIITDLICRAGYSCYYGKVQRWTQLQCWWGKEGRWHVAALAWMLAALESVSRGKGGGSHSPPRVFPRILPTYKAIFDLGCME